MAQYPTLSLCMIAKNEAYCIEQALSSVASIVSEIVLVDTGSDDGTPDIAWRFGATIISEPWQDDFAKHRNTSLEAARSEWILVLDADEVIDQAQLTLIRQLTSQPAHCYLLVQRHYTNDQRLSDFKPCRGEYPQWEREYLGYFESSLCRLFPNDTRIRYRNRIHELVEPAIAEHPDLVLTQSPIRLHHYGHTPEARERKHKTRLYTPLGERKIEEQPSTWKAYYELAVEHNSNGRHAESVAAFQKAAELNPNYTPTWVNYGYVLVELGWYEQAYRALSRALELEPRNPEADCNLGVMYMRQKNYPFAEAHLRRAIQTKPDYLNAYSNLGITLMKLGRISEGSQVFEQGYRLAPKNPQLLLRFGYSLLEVGILKEAVSVLQEVVKLAPRDPLGWQTLGQALEGLQLNTEAKLAYEKVRELNARP